MCKVLGVARTSYYDWLKTQPSTRSIERERLAAKVKELFLEGRCSYGTRRIRVLLTKLSFVISRRRVGKLMKQQNLVCKTKRKFKFTTDSKHQLPIAPNILNREFEANRPDEKYASDITYIWTMEGWLYLAVVIDLFSRKVVGWSMNDHMKASLVNDALLMAIWQRKPKHGLLSHTDRGSQYASDSHKKILKEHGVIQSMSRKGNCWDNAVPESFFHTLKTEFSHHINFETKEQAKQMLFEYIEIFYNRKRIHSANNYCSPVEYEQIKKVS
jgi:putative transposase